MGPRKLARVLASSLERESEQAAPSVSMKLIPPETELSQGMLAIDQGLVSDQSLSQGSPIDESPFVEAPPDEAVTPWTPLTTPSFSTPPAEAVDSTKDSSSRDRFLLVDDNPINLKILSSCMKKIGHPHDAVCNGKEAVEAFRQGAGAYTCIFMDLSMPIMSGFEAACLIRQQERDAKLEACTIFALTGLASAEAQQEAFACGIDLFLTKPVKLKELKQILASSGLS